MVIVIIILWLLLITAVVKALEYYIALCAYIRYTEEKEIIPEDEYIKKLMKWAANNMLSDIFTWK